MDRMPSSVCLSLKFSSAPRQRLSGPSRSQRCNCHARCGRTGKLQAVDRLAARAVVVGEVAALQLRCASARARERRAAQRQTPSARAKAAVQLAGGARTMKFGMTRWKMEPLLRSRGGAGHKRQGAQAATATALAQDALMERLAARPDALLAGTQRAEVLSRLGHGVAVQAHGDAACAATRAASEWSAEG